MEEDEDREPCVECGMESDGWVYNWGPMCQSCTSEMMSGLPRIKP